MSEFINGLISNLIFIFERLNWLSVVDIFLVTTVFFGILLLLRGTQAVVLLRGALLLLALLSILTSLEVLPAFSWFVQTTLPAVVLAIPVIFAPEIRMALERLGRARVMPTSERAASQMKETIRAVVSAASWLSERKHGALIVVQRSDGLSEYIQTGVRMEARVTPELLLQIFFPNTPLHDGAVIISGIQLVAAACVMPLSASGVLTRSLDRQMGLRHRAALGISEVSDAVVVVVSEESGAISLVHGGRMIQRLDAERLENVLGAFYHPTRLGVGWLGALLRKLIPSRRESRGE
ncbi:diadenylate cyclase CdaA [Chloroflexota bacterium]